MWPQWTVASYLLSGSLVSSVSAPKIALLGVWAYLARRAASFAFDKTPQWCQDDPEILKIGSYATGFIGSSVVLAAINLATKEMDGDTWCAWVFLAESVALAGCALYRIASGDCNREPSLYSERNRAIAI